MVTEKERCIVSESEGCRFGGIPSCFYLVLNTKIIYDSSTHIVLQSAAQYDRIYTRKGGADIMAARSANVNVRVEPDVKEQAEAILEKLGVSVSSFINMTYRQVILRKGIPFTVTVPSEL